MKMVNLKDSEGRVCCVVCGNNPPKGGQATGVGGLAPASHTVGS